MTKVEKRYGVPDFVCPKCGNKDLFQILILQTVVVSTTANQVVHTFNDNISFSNAAPCACNQCGHKDHVSAFMPEFQEDTDEPDVVSTNDKASFFVDGVEGRA